MNKYSTFLRSVLLISLFAFINAAHAQHWSITNIAGDGTSGTYSDSDNALETPIGIPVSLGFDSHGNLYFSVVGYLDLINSGIYKIGTDNSIEHILDSVPGIAGIVIDADDNIYFSRGASGFATPEEIAKSEWIYKFNQETNVVTTIAGTGVNSGGVLGPADATTNVIGDAASLRIDDSGEYLYYAAKYLADDKPWHNYIQRIELSTSITERVVGLTGGDGVTDVMDGTDALSADIAMGLGMDWDNAGHLYFATHDHMIKKVVDGKIYHVAGTGESGYSGDGGDAKLAQLNLSFSGFIINDEDELILADTENNRIRKIDLSTGIIDGFAGSGSDEDTDYPEGDLENGLFKVAENTNIKPYDLTLYEDAIYFSDRNYRLRKMFVCTNPVITSVTANKSVICKGDTVQLTLTVDPGDGEIWAWYQNLDYCESSEEPYSYSSTIEVVVTENETYYAVGGGGCTNKPDCYEYLLELTCKEYYNAITPNTDGKNDYLEIPALENFPVNTVVIYNRWGDLLELIENYDSKTTYWAGTNGGGDPVDSGTYYFTATAGNELIVSGWVEVIRD